MERKGISQEGLKLIACVTMLIDHIGAVFMPGYYLYYGMRIVGRVAFPIYCFLLAEGAHYTRDPKRYGLRLGAGMVLSELPFDLALFGGLTLGYQNVMVTMLLGYLAICAMKKSGSFLLKILIALPFAAAAELLRTDYGGLGVALIVVFALAREVPSRRWMRPLGLVVICLLFGGLEIFAVFALIPIALYRGGKRTHSKAIQWGFYLFYPVHLAVLALLVRM